MYFDYTIFHCEQKEATNVYSKDGGDFAVLFTTRENRRTPDPVLSKVRSRSTRASPLTPWL